jgi:hypothetical protein
MIRLEAGDDLPSPDMERRVSALLDAAGDQSFVPIGQRDA